MENEKMELWDSVCVTDPAFTKKVEQRGGFTAICAQYQIKNATAKWGPYGKAWGVKSLQYGYLGPDDTPIEATLDAVFFYPGGEFPIATDLAYRTGNDTMKKLLTDLTTKALSKLGFNSDVFEGKFDDNKYVGDLKEEKKKAAKKKPPVEKPQTAKKTGATKEDTKKVEEHLARIADHFKLFTEAYGAERAGIEMIGATEFPNEQNEMIPGFDNLESFKAWLKTKKSLNDAAERVNIITHKIEAAWKKALNEEGAQEKT